MNYDPTLIGQATEQLVSMARADPRLLTLVETAVGYQRGGTVSGVSRMLEQQTSTKLLMVLSVHALPPDPMTLETVRDFFWNVQNLPQVRELMDLGDRGDNHYAVRCIRGWRTIANGPPDHASAALERGSWMPDYV